mmetsp:Transcript_43757/g.50320  ORF Transcript_43757/g.50320 Transcript_43757/m.50320 type:complete len:190 (+) Transcript_43757:118-687(+)
MSDAAECKIAVMGPGAVGKSALTIRLVTNNFQTEYDPTIEDRYRIQEKVDEKLANLDLLDTAGEDDYSTMRDQWMREGKGFLLVYSITSKKSFESIKQFRMKILQAQDKNKVPIVLVGNKCDLPEREVEEGQARALATEWGVPFFETSAKEEINNRECFYEVVREIRRFENSNPKPKPGRKFKWKCELL